MHDKISLDTDPIDALAEFVLANYWRITAPEKSQQRQDHSPSKPPTAVSPWQKAKKTTAAN